VNLLPIRPRSASPIKPNLVPRGDGGYVIDGRTALRSLNRALDWTLPTDGPRTVNGLVMEHLEAIPEPGARLSLAGYPAQSGGLSHRDHRNRGQPRQNCGDLAESGFGSHDSAQLTPEANHLPGLRPPDPILNAVLRLIFRHGFAQDRPHRRIVEIPRGGVQPPDAILDRRPRGMRFASPTDHRMFRGQIVGADQ